MRIHALLVTAVTCGCFGHITAAPSNGCLPVPVWQRIIFPNVRLPGQIGFLVTRQEDGLCLCIGGQKEVLESGAISARLFEADGTIVAPLSDPAESIVEMGSLGLVSCQADVMFPWGSNMLEEAWIKAAVGDRRIWLEIPYGFTRNPKDPPPKPNMEGNARFAPVMASLAGNTNAVNVWATDCPFGPPIEVRPAADIILHWACIQYSSIPIQNGWRLSFNKWNRLSANAEVVLHREDGYDLWKLHSPRTHIRVQNCKGSLANARAVGIRLEDDGMDRRDLFHLPPQEENRRCWTKLEIDVDEQAYFIEAPSSLCDYDHGTVTSESQTW